MAKRRRAHQYYKVGEPCAGLKEKEITCQPSVQSAGLITKLLSNTKVKSAVAKATVLLEKQVTARARGMFCVLAIVAGLAIAVSSETVTASTTVSFREEVIVDVGALFLLFLVMVVYKKANGIKVVW